jgi:hypothetical protein
MLSPKRRFLIKGRKMDIIQNCDTLIYHNHKSILLINDYLLSDIPVVTCQQTDTHT